MSSSKKVIFTHALHVHKTTEACLVLGHVSLPFPC